MVDDKVGIVRLMLDNDDTIASQHTTFHGTLTTPLHIAACDPNPPSSRFSSPAAPPLPPSPPPTKPPSTSLPRPPRPTPPSHFSNMVPTLPSAMTSAVPPSTTLLKKVRSRTS
eukprot:TRINITY_DN10554_c0_g1_i1.p1 TRINITY_DN10554_c0_g1~~TRINITY_DN10554_c0_g1_i1.p1  ORF type:complete len:113 (+),score=13.31 TRINITY_DN10554_c0_g1_i1:3-341(+)